eukprot:GILK01010395.1.p1 GENE.GILK01010395.1~~GILK01010395.1.p1  ORF type:complete len:490 (+),score=83.83 GILK01010395.1:99-1472(+)
MEQLPCVLFAGDVLRVHRMQVSEYRGGLQPVSIRFKTAVCVVSGEADSPIVVRSTSAQFTFTSDDEHRVNELRRWRTEYFKQNTLFQSLSIADIGLRVGADVVCKVLQIVWSHPPTGEQITLTVTDGSSRPVLVQVPPFHALAVKRLNITVGVWLRLRNVSGWSDASGNIDMKPASSLILLPEYLLDIKPCIERLHAPASLSSSSSSSSSTAAATETAATAAVPVSIKLCSLPHPSSSQLPLSSIRSILIQETEAQRLANGQRVTIALPPPQSMSSHASAPSTGTTVGNGTSEAVLQTVLHETVKYKCQARVLRYHPENVEQIVKRFCDQCKRSVDLVSQDGMETSPTCEACQNTMDFTYAFQLRLDDGYDCLDAIVHGPEAERFFHGIPPCDLRVNNVTRSILKRKLETVASPSAYIECCLNAYFVELADVTEDVTSARVKRRRRYRLFDTVLAIE